MSITILFQVIDVPHEKVDIKNKNNFHLLKNEAEGALEDSVSKWTCGVDPAKWWVIWIQSFYCVRKMIYYISNISIVIILWEHKLWFLKQV